MLQSLLTPVGMYAGSLGKKVKEISINQKKEREILVTLSTQNEVGHS